MVCLGPPVLPSRFLFINPNETGFLPHPHIDRVCSNLTTSAVAQSPVSLPRLKDYAPETDDCASGRSSSHVAIATNPRVKDVASLSQFPPALLGCVRLLCYVFDPWVNKQKQPSWREGEKYRPASSDQVEARVHALKIEGRELCIAQQFQSFIGAEVSAYF